MKSYQSQLEWLLLAIFVFCGFILNVDHVPLFDLDEGAFSEATREILESGVWAATYLDGLPRFDKPILTYWLQATSVLSFGLNELSLRLHSVIAACLWAASIFIFARQYLNRQTAMAAVMIFSSMLMITLIGRAATADAVLNLFICLSVFDIYRYYRTQNNAYLYRFWLWMSLGMLTKGPVAMLIPLLSSGIWLLSLKQLKTWRQLTFSTSGIAIMLLILTPWLYMVWREQGMDFFTGFIIEHNLHRFSSTRENHGGHLYYYLIVLPLVLLPYPGMLSIFSRFKSLWSRPLERLLIIWFLVVFILVSLSKTQLPHYVLYGVTPLVILFAKYRRLFNAKYMLWLFAPFLLLINIGLVLYAQNSTDWPANPYIHDMLSVMPSLFNNHYLFACLGLLALIVACGWLPISQWKKLVFAGLLQSIFAYNFFVPAYAQMQQAPVKAAAEYAKTIETPVVAYKINMPSFSVYRGQITQHRAVSAGDYVFTRSDRVEELTAQFGANALTVLFNQQGIVILKIKAL